MINIVFSKMDEYVLRKYFKGKEEVFCLEFFLDYGDINRIKEKEFRTVFSNVIEVQDILKKFNLLNLSNIRIWYSSANASDMCALYFLNTLIVDNFNGKSIVYIDVNNSDSIVGTCLSCVYPEEVSKFFCFEKVLTFDVCKEYVNVWNRLVSDNSEVRVLVDGRVIGGNSGFYDAEIVYNLNNNVFMKIYDLTNLIMYKTKETFILKDLFVLSRIKFLIGTGVFVIIKKNIIYHEQVITVA